MLDREVLVKELLTKIQGALAVEGKMAPLAFKAYDMGVDQTGAYMDAEQAVREFFDDSDLTLFRLVRDKRLGINGVFKAVMSPGEPQQINYTDYVLIIACFCAGVMNSK